ncbi:MAG: hypothetical protein KGO53_12885 [Alphaproteobacteria bacterium]|nr:hypothetical protein [Alphaproteobacteria bacterium]
MAADNPLAPAEQGKRACLEPDTQAKTCWTIASYSKMADGIYQVTQKTGIRNTTDFEIRTIYITKLKDGQICQTVEPDYLDNAKFYHMGDEMLRQDLANIRAIAAENMKNVIGKEVCMTLGAAAADGAQEFSVTIAGTPEKLDSNRHHKLLWVTPDDGYHLLRTQIEN